MRWRFHLEPGLLLSNSQHMGSCESWGLDQSKVIEEGPEDFTESGPAFKPEISAALDPVANRPRDHVVLRECESLIAAGSPGDQAPDHQAILSLWICEYELAYSVSLDMLPVDSHSANVVLETVEGSATEHFPPHFAAPRDLGLLIPRDRNEVDLALLHVHVRNNRVVP